jgi:hypothetical protein
MMHPIPLVAVASLLLMPPVAAAQEYRAYNSTQDFFSVAFPGDPAIQTTTQLSEYHGVFPTRVYSLAGPRGRFSVTVVDYTDAERIHTERVKSCPPDAQSECAGDDQAIFGIGSWRYDVQSAQDQAARAFLLRDAKVTHFSWAVVDRVPGRQIHLTNADKSRTFVAIHMHEGRLYTLEATVPAGAPEPGLFQQSLQFLDRDGKPIRYTQIYVVGQPAPGRLR